MSRSADPLQNGVFLIHMGGHLAKKSSAISRTSPNFFRSNTHFAAGQKEKKFFKKGVDKQNEKSYNLIVNNKKGRYKIMTDKERTKIGMTKKGLEVSEIGATLQWTMKNGQTCIQWFDENGDWIKTEWH